MFDFVRLAMAVPHTAVGAVRKNTESILNKIEKADKTGAQYVIFPELALTGYTCADLFFAQPLLEETLDALAKIARLTEQLDITVLVGAPIRIDSALYNCAVVLSGGRIVYNINIGVPGRDIGKMPQIEFEPVILRR